MYRYDYLFGLAPHAKDGFAIAILCEQNLYMVADGTQIHYEVTVFILSEKASSVGTKW